MLRICTALIALLLLSPVHADDTPTSLNGCMAAFNGSGDHLLSVELKMAYVVDGQVFGDWFDVFRYTVAVDTTNMLALEQEMDKRAARWFACELNLVRKQGYQFAYNTYKLRWQLPD